MNVHQRICILGMLTLPVLAQAAYQKICLPQSCSVTAKSAARILSRKMKIPADSVISVSDSAIPQEGQIILTVLPLDAAQAEWAGPAVGKIEKDGYAVIIRSGAAMICGARPRSLLYAAADYHLWNNKSSVEFVRTPSFAVRVAQYDGSLPIDEYVAALGANVLIDRRADSDREHYLLNACHNADVEYDAFLYGNNYQLWSSHRYDAAIRQMPSIQGTPAPQSWEKATLCPSDSNSWKLIDTYVRDYLEKTQADGLYTTFWDDYGLYCQCDRCVKSGMNKFPNQLYECVRHYHQVAASRGKKLIVRTWSSGTPHWIGDKWVHAPGYDHFGGSGLDLWGRVIRELPKDIFIQTKVYQADCQPDPPFGALLGQASPHTEIAEYQITGQTTGRFYFPASTVDHTAWTMKKSLEQVGPQGGVCLFPGGTHQSHYSLLDDILNSINVYAWRQLSWDVDANMEQVWKDWAEPIYGPKAAPHIIRAIRLSEEAVNKTFSTLAMGSETNSGFSRTIERREALLMYTNRHFLPDYAKTLEPTRENIQRVIDEKTECLKKIDIMFAELEKARPYLTQSQADELQTRFEWLKEYAVVARYLDESLWRYRYLRYLSEMRTTDPQQMNYLAAAFDAVQEHYQKLFRYSPRQQFSCYDVPLSQLRNQPSLGTPLPLMRQLYDSSKAYVELIVGPDFLPAEWKR